MSQPQEVIQLSPESILADDNVRHGLRQSAIDRLAESIIELNGVQEPISVEAIEDTQDNPDISYRLLKGFYRHAAVTKLNKDGAGLTLPAIVRPTVDETMRLKLQVTENVAREALSPMDTAVSIKKLLDAGVSKSEVRRIFTRPATGKAKGNQPASTAWIGIMLNLLTLPKGIQTKIHEGKVTVTAAYELGKVPAEDREAVLEKAEAEVVKVTEREEADEVRYLKAQQKADEKAEAEKAAADALVEAQQDVKDSEQLVKDKLAAFNTTKKVTVDPADEKAVKANAEAIKAAQTDYKGAVDIKTKAINKLAKLTEKANAAKDDSSVAKADAKAKKPAKKQAKAVGPKEVKAAAGTVKFTSLKAAEAMQAFKDVAKAKAPKVAAIGAQCLRLLTGELTPKLLIEELEAVLAGKKS